MELLRKIEQYCPWNRQEAQDREELLLRLRRGEELFTRENTQAHWTASAWVTDPKRERVLMAYHKLYDSWAWLGGHADGETDLLAVAIREAQEESGLEQVRPVTEEIYSLEILPVSGHEKKGVYVPPHLHLNLTFLLEEHEQVIMYLRRCARQTLLVIANQSDLTLPVQIPEELKKNRWVRILSNRPDTKPSLDGLREWLPWEAEIYTLDS